MKAVSLFICPVVDVTTTLALAAGGFVAWVVLMVCGLWRQGRDEERKERD